MTRLHWFLVTGVLVAGATWGCGGEDGPPSQEPREAWEAVVPAPGDDPVRPDPFRPDDSEIPEPPGLATVRADTARGWLGPGGEPFEVTQRIPGSSAHLTQRIGQQEFALAARVTNPTLLQYPCTSCHEGTVAMGDRIEDAHGNIQPEHPAATGATCATCHVADSVQRLVLHDGATVSMDHAYQLCAQCHSGQTESWAAGVHGKRLEGWHGRRILMNCTDCHDPHKPELEPRVPYPGPQLIRERGSP